MLGLGLAAFFPFYRVPDGCLVKIAWGVPCPACGMTRSWIHLAHGRLFAAVRQNPLGTVLALVAAALVVYAIADLIWPRARPWLQLSTREALGLLAGGALIGCLNWAYGIWSGTSW